MRDTLTRAIRALDDPPRCADERQLSDYDLDRDRTARGAHASGGLLAPASVLVPIVARPDGHTLLFTQRAEHLQDHAGQISFPGGRSELHDEDAIATALRETAEEIGLKHQFIDVLGFLDAYETVTGFFVTPVVALVSTGFTLRLQTVEVSDAFEVPASFLLDPRNRSTHCVTRHGGKRRYYVYEYRDRYIWGATAGMINNLATRMARV